MRELSVNLCGRGCAQRLAQPVCSMLTVLRLRRGVKQHRCQRLLHARQRCGQLVVALPRPLRHLRQQRSSLWKDRGKGMRVRTQAGSDMQRPAVRTVALP